MKPIIIIFVIAILSLVVIQGFALKTQQNIETYPYKILKEYKSFEIRAYDARLFSTVKLNTKYYDESSRNGFSILAGYIFGGNEKNEKIAMTSPVVMTLEDSMTMKFMIPQEFEKSTLPQPNSSKIIFEEEPNKIVAAITFGGWANDQKIEAHKTELIEALAKEKIQHNDKFSFLGYNAPYEMSNRRNEVIVELVDWK